MFVLAVAISLTACGGSAPSLEFGKTDVDQIRAMVQNFVVAYNAKDIEKIATFYSANAALLPANRSTLRGIDAVKGYYETRVKDEGATDLAIEPMTVEGHGPLGFVAGTYSLNLKGPDGSLRHDRGKVLWIVHKYGAHWRFEWQIMSGDVPTALPAGQ
jgi:ketosteroid isomerase-like protein